MVTIKEIAKAVGVSSATVSRVLNYDPTLSISPAKREAIIETAEALNYSTPRARNKINGQVGTGLLPKLAIVHFLEPSDELGDPYYIGVRLGIENRCREQKTEIIKFYHMDSMPDPALIQGVSGVIAVGKQSGHEVEWLKANARHLVFADFNPHDDEIDSVESDLVAATKSMLDAAHAMGYRRIGFIGSVENLDGGIQQFGEKRSKAYKEWQEAHGTWEPELCILGDNCGIGQNLRLETGYKLASRILALKDRPDIFLTANDNMAIGAYRAIQEAGLSIPDDIAVMSFNDIPVAQFLTPALSTMKIFGEPIGETAFDLLAERVSGRDYTKTVTIPTRMIWRDSSRKPVI